jgi:hypothetical protein
MVLKHFTVSAHHRAQRKRAAEKKRRTSKGAGNSNSNTQRLFKKPRPAGFVGGFVGGGGGDWPKLSRCDGLADLLPPSHQEKRGGAAAEWRRLALPISCLLPIKENEAERRRLAFPIKRSSSDLNTCILLRQVLEEPFFHFLLLL